MKTKEEILEHLKSVEYDCRCHICGWLIGKRLKDVKEAVEFLAKGNMVYNFKDFLAWVDEDDEKTPSMDFLKRLSRASLEEEDEDEDEVTYKADYIAFYNNAEYMIIADGIKEFADALCFFKGEDKVASFPAKTPWIKI